MACMIAVFEGTLAFPGTVRWLQTPMYNRCKGPVSGAMAPSSSQGGIHSCHMASRCKVLAFVVDEPVQTPTARGLFATV
jgi:hypothetical protein